MRFDHAAADAMLATLTARGFREFEPGQVRLFALILQKPASACSPL